MKNEVLRARHPVTGAIPVAQDRFGEGNKVSSLRKRRFGCLLSVCVIGMLTSSAFATTYYVDGTQGSDSNTGLGPGSDAFKTIEYGISKATASGDELLIADGTYVLTSGLNQKSKDGVTYRSLSGNRDKVVIDGDGCNYSGLCHNEGAVTVRDLTFQNFKGGTYGAALGPFGANSIVSNCVVRGCSGSPVSLPTSGGLVADCVVTGNVGSCGITIRTVNVNNADGIVRACLVADNAGQGVLGSVNAPGMEVEGTTICRNSGYGAQDVATIRDCNVYSNGSTQVLVGNGQSPTIVGTEIWGGVDIGIGFQETSIHGLISGCTIHGCGGVGIRATPRNASAGDLIVTNTVVYLCGSGLSLCSGSLAVDCVISNNTSSGQGAGVTLVGASTLRKSKVIGNYSSQSSSYSGAGVYGGAQSRIENCDIIGNSTAGRAGGVLNVGYIADSRICGNSASNGIGGGVVVQANVYPFVMTNCVVSENVVNGLGGGVAFTSSSMAGEGVNPDALITHCVISGNKVTGHGGGISLYGAVDPAAGPGTRIRNCLLVGNSVSGTGNSDYGGAISSENNTGSLVESCTIVSNVAAKAAGIAGGTIPMTNCVVACNFAPDGTMVGGMDGYKYFTNANLPLMGYLLIYPGSTQKTGDWSAQGCVGIYNGVDPKFADATQGNWRLKPSSPVAKAGKPFDWMVGAVDLLGKPRKSGGTVAYGAFEQYSGPGFYLIVR